MWTDDENGDIVRVLTPNAARMMVERKVLDSESTQLNSGVASIPLMQTSYLDDINRCCNDFPKQYRFLLGLPIINEETLKEYPKFYFLVFNKQVKTVEEIIEKEIAILSLNWAHAYHESNHPLLQNIKLGFVRSRMMKSCKDVCRVIFKAENLTGSQGRLTRDGMVVVLKTENGQCLMARVHNASSSCCEFSIVCKSERELEILRFNNSIVDVFEVLGEFLLTSMIRSIEAMQEGFLNHVVMPEPRFDESHANYAVRKNRQMDAFMDRYSVSRALTQSQRDAVFAICNKEHKKFPFVLFGPPGTGKTFTISQTIQTILKMNDENRVLICTPSNMAADRVAERLVEDFGEVLNKENVLRLRSTGNNYYQRDRRFEDIYYCKHSEELFAIPSNFDQWRVVVCTLGCSSHIANNTETQGFFSHIFIDETGQASQAETWIPIGLLATIETSIVLCGDPKQLGPVIKLDISKELKDRFISPLVRYMDIPKYQTDSRLFCQLVDCFRCPKALTSIISKLFYNETLLNIVRRPDKFDYSGLEMTADVPMLFIDVNGVEERQQKGFSYCNRDEAKICVEYIKYLINVKGVVSSKIGVISPYTYQSKIIIDELRKYKTLSGPELVVNSVERFQGSERDVIIMTATRTAALGFMADDLRVNTSLTRAKKMLIVIGNENALQRHPSWKQFIAYCREMKAHKKWNPRVDPNFVDDDVLIIEGFGKMEIS